MRVATANRKKYQVLIITKSGKKAGLTVFEIFPGRTGFETTRRSIVSTRVFLFVFGKYDMSGKVFVRG